MPILPENKARYPKDWYQISLRIRRRANWRCEDCGVRDGWLGGRMRDGYFLRAEPTGTGGNAPSGLTWPAPGDWGWCSHGATRDRLRIVRIVLTVAHLDHTPENCADDNLKALCQRCHNILDLKHRRETIRAKRFAVSALGDLFQAGAP